MASSAAMEANRYTNFIVLEILANVVSLINSLGGRVRCRTQEAASHYGENTSLFRSIVKMVRKWQNLQEISISQKH